MEKIRVGIREAKQNLSKINIKNLEKNGWIAPPKKMVRNVPPPIPVDGELAQKILQEDRNQ